MPYIGNTNTTQAFTPAVDFFNGNGSTTAFTLSRPVASVAQVQVAIENVPQNPGDAFTVSGNTITFTSAPPSGTQNIYVYYTSPITQVIAPGQSTVGTTQIQDSAVTTAKIAAGAVIPADLSTGAPYWDTSGNVGIGTSSPDSKLTVYNATGTSQIRFGASSNYYWDISRDNDTTGNLWFSNYNASGSRTTRMVIDTGGNVGIGTASPAASLSISKQTTALSGTSNSYGVYLYPTSSGQCWLDAVTSSSSNTSMGLRSYNNGTYYTANLSNNGNFQFNSGYGSTATAYGCRAWVNFNGTGTVAIRASGNVSSITDNGTGDYTVNFTSAMPDANYSAVVTNVGLVLGDTRRNSVIAGAEGSGPTTMTTSAIRLNVGNPASASLSDNVVMNVAIFR